MTSSIVLSAALVNAVVVLALAAAVASPRVSPLARLVIATSGFTCAWLTTAGFAAARLPNWTMYMGGAVIMLSIVVVIGTLHRWTQAGHGDDSQPEDRGDEGGGGPQRRWPDAPHQGGGGSEPIWWPEFERPLALYVDERQREKRQSAVLVAHGPAARGAAGGDRRL